MKDLIEVEICKNEGVKTPFYATEGAAGMDLHADIEEPIVLKPLDRALVQTGIRIGLPEGVEAQIRPRSGMALKHGISVLNTPGTIDEDYTGYVGIIAVNLSNEEYTIQPGERIAQMVFNRVCTATLKEVIGLNSTKREIGGFGSTGK